MTEHYKHQIIKVSELKPYANNARTHSAEQVKQVANSIKEFGFTNPILIDEDHEIIAGHGRLMAATYLELESVPCVILAGLTKEQKMGLVIADNQLALNAGWDFDVLKSELETLKDLDFDIDLLGFSDDFLKDLIDDPIDGLVDEDEVPEPPEDPICQPGDIWQLGNHRLMCGDSTMLSSVEELMNGHKADLVFTDPPYNVAYEGSASEKSTIANDDMSTESFDVFMTEVFTNLYTVMADGAPIYVTCPLEDGVFQKSFLSSGLKLQSILIWVKDSLVLGRKDYHYQHEPILYGWKEGAAHYWCGGRDKTTIIHCEKPKRNGVHPTMKPIKLIEILLGNSMRRDAVVVDLFGGSGSTLIACEKLRASAYIMELDNFYIDVIIKRWQEFSGKKAIHSSGKTYDEMLAEKL